MTLDIEPRNGQHLDRYQWFDLHEADLASDFPRDNQKVECITVVFALSLAVFEILMFQMFDLESLDHGHQVQHS